MTIEDAIKRAKLLGQARLQRESSPDIGSHRGGASHEAARPAQLPVMEPAVPLEPLKTVDVSLAACEANRILVTEAQLREFPAADASFRLLRSRLQNRLKQNNWFSLAITSPSQGDGKTVTSVNLAISVAREKLRPVYLLDLDMRNPSVYRMLGIVGATPLPDYLNGRAKPEQVLFQTTIPNLVVAGAATPTESASELLAGPRFSELLSHIRLRSRHALVIVDCPPVNLTDEALLVGPRVDAFLMVVSEGKTERKHFAQAIGTLGEFTMAGVVVNRSSDSDSIEYSHYSA
jgi:capsular exopolysaccharide synthesis family protein